MALAGPGNRARVGIAMARIGAVALFAALALSRPDGAVAADGPVLVTPINSVDTVISEVVLREAYRRIGIAVVIRKYPAERALQMADRGEVAGEVQRIDGINRKYKNLIQLRPPINFIEGTVFTKSVTFDVTGWDSLRDYRIGVIRGIKFAERHTQGMKTYAVGGYERLFHMLAAGRFQIAISPRFNGLYQIRRLQIAGLKDLSPAVMRFDLFHYLHRSQADLAARLEPVLRAMAASGALATLRRHVITVMLRRAAERLPPCDDDYRCFE
jgi:ABC-type amino acid transport substrate-binding protein